VRACAAAETLDRWVDDALTANTHRRGARLSVTFTAPQPRKLTRLADELTRPVDELACTFGEVTCTFGEVTCAVVKLAGPVGSLACAVDELTCTFGEVTCAVVELAGPVGGLTCAVDELTCAVDELTRTFGEVTCTVVKLAGPIGSLTCAADELICVVNELICVVDELTRQRRLHLTARGGHAELPARAGRFRGGDEGLVSRRNGAVLAHDGELREAEGEAGAPIGLFLWVGGIGEQYGSFWAGTEGFVGVAEGFDFPPHPAPAGALARRPWV